ncbi:uncharacterized protein LOC144451832 [Glandiceps talaboti]
MFSGKGSKTPRSGKKRNLKITDEGTPVLKTPKVATPATEKKTTESKSVSAKKRKSLKTPTKAVVLDKEVSSSVKKTSKNETRTPKLKKDRSVGKEKKTPKSGKKRKIEDKVEQEDAELDDQSGDDDDSFVITFPKIDTSTPKVTSLDTTIEDEETEKETVSVETDTKKKETQTPKGSKKTQEARKKTPKREIKSVESSEETPKITGKKEAKGTPSLNLSKTSKVTVEEGSLEMTDSTKIKPERKAVQSVNLESNKEIVPEKENEQPAETSKRSASESGEEDKGIKKMKLDKYPVHCGNLPNGVNRETLYFFLGECDLFPKIEFRDATKMVRHGRHKKTKLVKYAVLTFDTEEDANAAVELNGMGMPSPMNGKESNLMIYHMIERTNDSGKLYMGNLSLSTQEKDLLELFDGQDLEPDRVIIVRRQTSKKSKGYGFVWFEDKSMADRALKLNGTVIKKKPITVRISKNKDEN